MSEWQGSRRAARSRPQYVDWEFAKATGRRWCPPGPKVTPPRPRRGRRRSARRPRPPGSRSPRPRGCRRPADAPAALVVDRPGWIGAQRRLDERHARPGHRRGHGRRLAQPAERRAGHRRQGHRRRGRRAARVHGQQGARAVRPGARRYPRLMLVAPNIVHAERELGVDRDDFRLWVCMHEETHRVQFTANPWLRDHLIAQDPRAGRRHRSDARRAGRTAPGDRPAGCPRPSSRGRTGLAELLTTPSSATKVAAAHRGDVAARGPRRRRDGRRRARRHPDASRQIRERFTQRRKGAGARPHAAPAAGPRGQDAPVPRRGRCSSAGSGHRSASTASTPIWASPETLPLPGRDRRPAGLGPARPRTMRRSVVTGPASAVAADPARGPDGAVAVLPEGAVVLVACSGGADSLALAAAVAFEAPQRGIGPAGVVVDHGLQPGSTDGRRVGGRSSAATWASTRSRSQTVRVPRRRRGSGGGRPVGPVPRPRGRRRPDAAPPPCSSGTPATTRPSRCCSASPAGPARGRCPGCRAARGLFVRPFSPWGEPRPRPRLRRRRDRPVGRPAQRGPGLRAGPGPRAAAPTSSASSAPASPRRSPARADLLREDADYLEDLARRRACRRWAPGRGRSTALLALPRAVRTRVWRLLAVEAGAPARGS